MTLKHLQTKLFKNECVVHNACNYGIVLLTIVCRNQLMNEWA